MEQNADPPSETSSYAHKSCIWIEIKSAGWRNGSTTTTRGPARQTYVEKVLVRQRDALDLSLYTRQRCVEVTLDPLPFLGVTVRETPVAGVRTGHVRREGVVEPRRFDCDELMILVLEGDCRGETGILVRHERPPSRQQQARAKSPKDSLPKNPAAKLSADFTMRSWLSVRKTGRCPSFSNPPYFALNEAPRLKSCCRPKGVRISRPSGFSQPFRKVRLPELSTARAKETS
jgi:hypothetical protein